MSLQNSIDAITGTALVYKDYITGTCFTGSQTLGAGHDLISGKQGADLIAKSLVGGTNVTLSSDDSTITINASAGGGGGGGSSSSCFSGVTDWSGISDVSNLYTGVPENIFVEFSDGYYSAQLQNITSAGIVYSLNPTEDKYLTFNNNAQGTFSAGNYTYDGPSNGRTQKWTATTGPSLSGLISSGYFYHGGGCSSSAGGGGSCGENGIGPGSMSGIAERSNFSGRLPDVIYGTVQGAGNPYYWRVPLYLAEIEKPGATTDRIYYRPLSNAGTNYIEFENDANGTYRTVGGIVDRMYDGAGNDFSLQQYVSSGYAAFYNSGCGGGSADGGGGGSSSGGIGSNSFITGASNFYTNLPDYLVLSFGGAPNAETPFHLHRVEAGVIEYEYNNRPTYADPVTIKFSNDSSGTFDTWVNTTSYGAGKSLSGYIADGRGVYLGGGGSSSAGGDSSAGGGGGAGDGYVLSVASGYLAASSSYDITLDGTSNYIVDIIGRKSTSTTYSLGLQFKIDSSDGTITDKSNAWPGKVYESYDVPTKTLTLSTDSSHEIVSSRIFKKSSAGGGASVAQSTYVGDGATTGIYIPLSFTPNKVEIHSAGSPRDGGPYYGKTTLLLSQSGQNSIYTYKNAANTQIARLDYNGTISGQGFLAKGHINDSSFNVNGCTYHYFAI